MSTFSKLSLVAQYDDMCRLVNKYIRLKEDDEDQSIQMLEAFLERRRATETAHKQEKDGLRDEIGQLQKQIKKLNRELVESRTALAREGEEKNKVARERKALWDQIQMVRELVENNDGLKKTDPRVISCLDVKRLSPIYSDDSSDGASGLEYDHTEEISDLELPAHISNMFDDDDRKVYEKEPRRSSRRQSNTRQSTRRSSRGAATATTTTTSTSNAHFPSHKSSSKLGLDTDSNDMDTDENNIEFVRQQLKKHEEQLKAEKLATAASTPNIKDQHIVKSMTLSSKSAATLNRCVSNAHTPAPAAQQHSFITKRVFRPESCGPCGAKIAFYKICEKCENCGAVSHTECKDMCPLPCVKITAPANRSRTKKILISDFVNSDAAPKVPALIVHCCNEIEKGNNILTEGLYRVVVKTCDVEALQDKILKSRSGMPNLSNTDVHLLCAVVKRFLQSLDESLITTTLWSHFSEAVKSNDKMERSSHIEFYISNDLPSANRDTLAFMMQHLHTVARHCAQNKMNKNYLCRSLAPTIIGNSCRNASPQLIQQENSMQLQIMETIFEIDEKFWSNFIIKGPVTPAATLGSRLLRNATPSNDRPRTRSSSRFGATLPTPKLKPLFS